MCQFRFSTYSVKRHVVLIVKHVILFTYLTSSGILPAFKPPEILISLQRKILDFMKTLITEQIIPNGKR